MDPKMFVSTIWPILPTAIATAPIIRRLGERKNTLPPYSPIRFGVNTAQVKPQKTDSIDFQRLIRSIGSTKRLHLMASRPQFKNISMMTNASTKMISVSGICLNSCWKSLRS